MAFNIATSPIYVKGTMEVWVRNYLTGDLDYYSKHVQSNQFQTTATMGDIHSGIGNPIDIQILDTCAANLTLTNADFSLDARKLAIGGTVAYNAIVPVCESITASGATLSVTETPVAPYGINSIVCYINNDGTAYEVDASTKAIAGFTATSGTTYIVRYFKRNSSARVLSIGTQFAPDVKTVTLHLCGYSANGSSDLQSTYTHDLYIWIPRMQFSAKVDTEGTQTTPATTDLSGTALSYDEALAVLGGAIGCSDSPTTKLAYIVEVPRAGATSAVQGLVVVGGVISLAASGTVQCPVKYQMPDGSLQQPTYTDLDYVITSTAVATVSAGGVITGVAAGDTEITITLDSPALTCVANVEVT